MNEQSSPPSRMLSALTGLVAGLLALGVAELVAGVGETLRSPVVDVGDRVIDLAPSWLKDVAIALFGTNDKIALLVGIALLFAGYAAGVGLLALRRDLRLGVAAVAVFGVLGAAAALAGGRGLASSLPSLVGTGAAAGLLSVAHAITRPTSSEEPTSVASESRRRLLVAIGTSAVVAGAGFAGGRRLAGRFDVADSIATTALPPVGDPLPPVPAAAQLDVPGLSRFVTPNAEFYRIDTALTVPQVSREEFTLRIHGLVDRELLLTYDDLVRRTQIESDITLTCVSNEVGGRLVGNARWQGVRLDDLLREAGVQPEATQVVGRSVDDYTCGFPVAAAMDGRDAMVAIGMNGEPLPLIHGFPARLVVPGLYGYVSATKWLSEIELTTFEAFDHYWERRDWAEQAPIKTQSRIDTPAALSQLSPGPAVIAGVAWAQTRGIAEVEVKIDDGPWLAAELGAEVNNTTWRQWRLPWEVTPGRHEISCRATDKTGQLQPEERTRPIPNGADGWHSLVVIGMET